jgi:hypothetical protein
MHKALLHNSAQSHKVTKIHVFSQLKTKISSRAHEFYMQSVFFAQRKQIAELQTGALPKHTYNIKEKKNDVVYICLQRLLLSSRHNFNDK